MTDPTTVEEPQTARIFLGRQPILGREQQLLAYELFYRDGPIATSNRAEILDPAQSAVSAIADAFAGLVTQQALGPYRCYIDADRELLFSELIEALPPQLVVLEIADTVEPSPDVLARCQALRELGFTLAVDDVPGAGEAHGLLELADIIKLDVTQHTSDALSARVLKLKSLGRKLLAEKVETAEQMDLCKRLGFDLFQGYFFAQPAVIVGKKLNPSQLALVRLLTLVMEDAETSAIENAFKLEPGLTINMLRLTNSVGSGLDTKITSLRHAIAILGRRQLQRWLQLLIYTNPRGGSADAGVNPLLQLAATRGRLMELLADRLMSHNREFSDQAFMVGIMSLMPALLGVAMIDILAQLPVGQRVKMALADGSGQLGQLLQLVAATEQIDPEVLELAHSRLPGLSAEFLEHSLAQALSWANHLGEERDEERVDGDSGRDE